MKKQMRAIFSGRVQGVGFRFTAESTARSFQVTGYVRNLSNGTVELLAEGEDAELKAFLEAVKSSAMEPYIRETEVSWTEAQNQFQKFSIRT